MTDKLTELRVIFEHRWSIHVSAILETLRSAGLPEVFIADSREFLLRRGKRIRPLLFLATCEQLNNQGVEAVSKEPFLNAALGLELLHAFVLVHDDVIDRSTTRRGLPSLHNMYCRHFQDPQSGTHTAQSMAVVLGDVLFAEAFNRIITATSGTPHQHAIEFLFLEVVRDTGIGELRDIQMSCEPLENFTESDVTRMYWLKTTRYTIELPLVLAYLMTGGSEEHVKVLTKYAELVGLAFQILNDLSELDSSQTQTNGDILDDKKTWLMVRMMESLDETNRAFLKLCLSQHPRDERFVHKIKLLMEKSQVRQKAVELVERLFEQANSVLQDSDIPKNCSERIRLVGQTMKKLIFP